jgi:NADH-quinone oxidoreductase subunit C
MNSEEVFKKVQNKWFDKLVAIEKGIDCPVFTVKRENLIEFAKFIKEDDELSFDLINDVTAVDYPYRKPRFDVVYHVFSIRNSQRIRIKTAVEEEASVKSVTSVWKGAEWLERETYDMFGIGFEGHPDLRRILMMDDFKYYPLRKDFPLEGYEES